MVNIVRNTDKVKMPPVNSRRYIIWEQGDKWGVEDTHEIKVIFKGDYKTSIMTVYSMNVNYYKSLLTSEEP